MSSAVGTLSSGHHNIIYIYKTLKKKKKKKMLLHIRRTLSIISRFKEGKKQTPKTILCIFPSCQRRTDIPVLWQTSRNPHENIPKIVSYSNSLPRGT